MRKRYPATILATACIPWDASWDFEEDRFRLQIRKLVERGIRHIYLFGTAGEGYAVTDEQYERIVTVFADEMRHPGLYPMVGLVSLSLATMMKRLAYAYSQGIRDYQFALPSWGALSDRELDAFMHALCEPYPDCRFLHYNLLRSKRLIGIQEYAVWAKKFPNFAGAKFTTVDIRIIHELMETPTPLQFFLGELGFGYARLIGGTCGLLISLGNSNIARAQAFYRAAEIQNAKRLAEYQREFAGLLRGIMKAVGSSSMDGAYDKLFYKLLDTAFPLRLLPPYESSTDEQFESYRCYLQREQPEWLEGEAR